MLDLASLEDEADDESDDDEEDLEEEDEEDEVVDDDEDDLARRVDFGLPRLPMSPLLLCVFSFLCFISTTFNATNKLCVCV